MNHESVIRESCSANQFLKSAQVMLDALALMTFDEIEALIVSAPRYGLWHWDARSRPDAEGAGLRRRQDRGARLRWASSRKN
jgi:hypothetical protein